MILNYSRSGAGASLFLLHGLFGSLTNWGTIGRRLAERFDVVAVDLRNHGRSPHSPIHTYPDMAADVVEMMDALGIEHVHLVGHSMGGKVAMECALSFPDRIKKLIVEDIAPVAYSSPLDEITDILLSINLAAFSSRGAVEKALRPRVPDDRMRQFLLTNLRRDDKGGFSWRMNLSGLKENLGSINGAIPGGRVFGCPALFLSGELSEYVTESSWQAILSLFPRAVFQTVPEAGHWVHADAPEAVVGAINDFLGGESKVPSPERHG